MTASSFDPTRLAATILTSYNVLAEAPTLSLQNPAVKQAARNLTALALAPVPQDVAQQVLANPQVKAVTPALQSLNTQLTAQRERELVGRLAQMDDRRLSRVINSLATPSALVREEVAALKEDGVLPNKGSIILAGAGWLPVSAVMLAQASRLPVSIYADGADQGNVVQAFSRKANSQITTLFMPPQNAQYRNAQLVLLGRNAANKEAVIAQVLSTGPQASVAMRTPQGLGQLLYQPLDERALAKMPVTRRVIGRNASALTVLQAR